MKISLVAAINALWTILYAFGSVNATECSTADLDTLKSVRDDTLKGICASSFAAGPPPANSTVPPFCGNEDCLSTLKSAVNDLPDCEINGLSIVASVKMMIIMCSSGGTPPPMPPGAANGSLPMPLPPPRPGNGPLLAWLAAAGDTNDSSDTSSNDADVEDASSASSMEGKEATNGSATVPTPAPSAAARYHVALATFVAVGASLIV